MAFSMAGSSCISSPARAGSMQVAERMVWRASASGPGSCAAPAWAGTSLVGSGAAQVKPSPLSACPRGSAGLLAAVES